jgi:subtilase family serine protease
VSADAGGNMAYISPLADMLGLARGAEGTSASTPLWAALLAQIDAICLDQGLPQLGYMNDLLYAAAAIAPASFNDITVGNNVTSFKLGGPIVTENGDQITLTGFGYHAGPGYDLTTGLGSPNGTLLARALTTIRSPLNGNVGRLLLGGSRPTPPTRA